MTENDNSKFIKTVNLITKDLSPRNKDIVTRRFGLKKGEKETLESIGKNYGITRERVRQIEEFTLAQVAKAAQDNQDVKDYIAKAKDVLNQNGGVMSESDLFKSFTGSDKENVFNASLTFVLSLTKDLVNLSENNNYHSFWALSSEHAEHFKGSVASLISKFETNDDRKLVPHESLLDFAKRNGLKDLNNNLSEGYVKAILTISKDLDKNIYNEVGLAAWPEIKPRGVKDKAYLVLKKESEPKHFVDIARLINSANFSDRKANVQTVHNELIKDKRFVLVGRGTYALSEWGYNPGTVKKVLIDILKNSDKPLNKAELIVKMKNARLVKENTILLNLQDSKVFKKNEDGSYTLKEA